MKTLIAIVALVGLAGCTTADALLLSQSQDFANTVVPVMMDQYADPAPTPRSPQQITNMQQAVEEHRAALARYQTGP